MAHEATILKELEEISPVVANLSRRSPHMVPPGYFETLPAAIMQKIQAETVAFGSTSTPFQVPEGYFESLPAAILKKVAMQSPELSVAEELADLAPVLSSVSKGMPFRVPEGYFESLEVTVPMKLARPSGNVFRFSAPKKWLQYAVAACVASILFIGGLWVLDNRANHNAVISYDAAVQMNVDDALDAVNEQAILAYLNEAPGVGYALNSIVPEDFDVEDFIETTSQDDIEAYLQEYHETGRDYGSGS